MKLTKFITGLALLAFASSAFAQQTIEITGATAFRVGAVRAIIALYQTSGSTLTDIAHSGTTSSVTGHEGASDSIFRGTINNAATPGITVIRASWSGSVEGLNAVANAAPENYLTIAAFSNGTTYAPVNGNNVVIPGVNAKYNIGTGTPFAQVADTDSELAFSDVFPGTADINGLTDTIVGVLPFFAVINDGAPTTYTAIAAQKFGQLADTGFLPAKYIFPTTSTTNVYLTGRNDGSGTRATYLAISRGVSAGFGRNQAERGDVASVVNQYRADAPVSDEIPVLRRWPTGDINENRSTVFNVDTAGNGGYASGGTVANRLAAKTSNVQIQNAGGTTLFTRPAHLISIVGLSDAVTAVGGGARVLAWEGTPITVSGTLAGSELAKFYDGSYTLWSYEHLTYLSLDAAEDYVREQITALIPSFFGSSGIDNSLMKVDRADDGTDVRAL